MNNSFFKQSDFFCNFFEFFFNFLNFLNFFCHFFHLQESQIASKFSWVRVQMLCFKEEFEGNFLTGTRASIDSVVWQLGWSEIEKICSVQSHHWIINASKAQGLINHWGSKAWWFSVDSELPPSKIESPSFNLFSAFEATEPSHSLQTKTHFKWKNFW